MPIGTVPQELVEAAPDLLAALKAVAAHEHVMYEEFSGGLATQIRDAIARAEGVTLPRPPLARVAS